MNTPLDEEFIDLPPDLKKLYYANSNGDAYPGRRNQSLVDSSTLFNHSDFTQAYPEWEPTNSENSPEYMQTSDRQPVMPLEITGAAKLAVYRKYKLSEFDTDDLDPRPRESLNNLQHNALLLNPSYTDNIFKNIEQTNFLNSQGEDTNNAWATGKEAARKLYGV